MAFLNSRLRFLSIAILCATFSTSCVAAKVPMRCLQGEYVYVTSENVRLALQSDGNFSLSVFEQTINGSYSYYPNEMDITFNVQSEPLSGEAVNSYLQVANMNYEMSSFVDAFVENARTSFSIVMGLEKQVFIIIESNDYHFSKKDPCE